MELKSSSILFFVYKIKVFLSFHVQGKNPLLVEESNEILKISGKINNYCFNKNQRNNIIFITESKNETVLIKSLFTSLIPINLLEPYEHHFYKKYKRVHKPNALNNSVLREYNNPATAFIIVISSESDVKLILENIKNSIWWNHEALFLLINNEFSNSCRLAQEFLHAMWTFNILFVVYVCLDLKNRLQLYTFNPYSQNAPRFWYTTHTASERNESWTLLRHNVQQLTFKHHLSLCNNLFFDKTENLSGYTLKINVDINSNMNIYDKTKIGYNRLRGGSSKIVSVMLNHINATITVKFMDYVGSVLDSKGVIKDLLTKTVDISMTRFFLRDYFSVYLYPLESNKVIIVTLKEPLSYGQKLELVFNEKVLITLFIICCVSVISLKYVLKLSIYSGILNFLRMLVGVSSLIHPISFLGKVVLMIVIWITLTLSCYIQSLLSAINTVHTYSSIIDSVEDLLKTNLTIYGQANFLEMISLERLRQRFHILDRFIKCIYRLKIGDRVACIAPERILRFRNFNSGIIHIAKNHILERSVTYVCAEDLPLLYKFNFIWLKLNEGGFLKFIYLPSKFNNTNNHKTLSQSENLKFQHLQISFYILIGGWVIALLNLLIENICFKITKCYKKLKVKW